MPYRSIVSSSAVFTASPASSVGSAVGLSVIFIPFKILEAQEVPLCPQSQRSRKCRRSHREARFCPPVAWRRRCTRRSAHTLRFRMPPAGGVLGGFVHGPCRNCLCPDHAPG